MEFFEEKKAESKLTPNSGSQISVIVPVYKVEPYLRQCVDSVLTQTFTDYELILVDDGSPDNCGAICDEYAVKDSRVRVIHKENGGLGNARNVGMDAARGKYIIFLDSDDYWEETTLEVLSAEAEKNDLDILFFSGEPFWDGMEPEKGRLSYQHTKQNKIIKSGPDSMKADMDHNEYYASACMRLYLLSFLRHNGFRFAEGILHEDESFSFLSYLAAERTECIADRLYKRRFRPDSIMTSKGLLASAHGYGVALGQILDAYHSPLAKPETADLFIRQIRLYMNLIFQLYEQSRKLQYEKRDSQAEVKQISADVQPVFRRAINIFKYLPKHLKIAVFSLPLAWWKKLYIDRFDSFLECILYYGHVAYRKINPKKK